MSIVETMRRVADRSGSEGIDVRRAVSRQTETRPPRHEPDTTGAERHARAIGEQTIRDRANKDLAIEDLAIEDRVKSVLQSSSFHLIQQLSCEVNDGVLILRGRVPSYYLKQIAQTVVLDLMCDGLVIDNQVEVDWT